MKFCTVIVNNSCNDLIYNILDQNLSDGGRYKSIGAVQAKVEVHQRSWLYILGAWEPGCLWKILRLIRRPKNKNSCIHSMRNASANEKKKIEKVGVFKKIEWS